MPTATKNEGRVSPDIWIAAAVECRPVIVFHTAVLLVGRLSILGTFYAIFLTVLAIHYALCQSWGEGERP